MTKKEEVTEEEIRYIAENCIKNLCKKPCRICGRGMEKVLRKPKERPKAILP